MRSDPLAPLPMPAQGLAAPPGWAATARSRTPWLWWSGWAALALTLPLLVLLVVDGRSFNGVSVWLDLAEYTFANADLTVHLHALPAGEWVCLDATTITGRDGIGMAESLLFDERGAIGRAVQTLLLERREPRGG